MTQWKCCGSFLGWSSGSPQGLWLNGDSEALTGLASGGIKGELPDDRGLGQWTVGPSDCLMTRQDWIGHGIPGTRVERVTDLVSPPV